MKIRDEEQQLLLSQSYNRDTIQEAIEKSVNNYVMSI